MRRQSANHFEGYNALQQDGRTYKILNVFVPKKLGVLNSHFVVLDFWAIANDIYHSFWKQNVYKLPHAKSEVQRPLSSAVFVHLKWLERVHLQIIFKLTSYYRKAKKGCHWDKVSKETTEGKYPRKGSQQMKTSCNCNTVFTLQWHKRCQGSVIDSQLFVCPCKQSVSANE